MNTKPSSENFTAIHPLRAFVVVDTERTCETHQRCELKCAAFGWCEVVGFYDGGDERLNYNNLDMLHNCGLLKEDTVAYTGASNALLINMLP
jgi:hypothetical protein